MKIALDPGEMAVASMIETMRRCVNQASSIKDQRHDSAMEAFDLDFIGAVAEVAFGKWKNTFPDLSINPRKGSFDALVGGKRVDIKATKRPNGRLLATTGKEHDAADIYVLAVVEGATVDFVGYATATELLSDETLIDLGHGKTHALTQDRLRAFKDAQ